MQTNSSSALIIRYVKKNATTPIKIATETDKLARLVIAKANILEIIAPTELEIVIVKFKQLQRHFLPQKIEKSKLINPKIPNIKVI